MLLSDRAQENGKETVKEGGSDHGRGGVLARALDRARLAILWERLWPALAAPAVATGLFLAASWLGLWLWLPPFGRAIGVAAFALLVFASMLPLLRLRLPNHEDALRRLDRKSGMPHRPATTIADELAVSTTDPSSLAIWRAHIERALRAAKELKAGRPAPRLAQRDPFALRALVLVLVMATFVAAGGDRMRRIATAFDWHGVITPVNYRIDAWVNPPTYTGKPPVILPGLRPGEPTAVAISAPGGAQTQPLAVPAGSTLVIRATGDIELDVAVAGGLADPKVAAGSDAKAAPVARAKGAEERRFTISDAGSATVHAGGAGDLTWRFTAIPDLPPKISLTKDPEVQTRGVLQLSYKVEDDYGVVDARALLALKAATGADGQSAPRPLFDAPDFPLALPQARTRSGVGQTSKDLTAHPWAGANVVMTLVAHDDPGQEGRSEPFEMRLPERPFVKPMARALIEQRRILAMDGEAQALVLTALDALTLAPERFNMETNVYLGVRSIFWQLAHAESDDQLRDVVTRMWDMAVNLEDGDLSDAQQALRNAEDRLRQALERGASDEEIKRLTDELRAALDKFMQALADQMRRNPQQAQRPLDQNQRMVRPQDLQSMIDRLEQMAKNGARDQARQLLQDLQAMLDNLQMGQQQAQDGDDGDDEMQQALNELGDMIQQQQELRDKTFQQGQDQRRQRGQQGQRGQQQQPGQGDQKSMGDLQQQQQALRDQLKKLMEEMRKRGMGQQQGQERGQGQGQQQGDQLGQAGDAMDQAQGQLGQGNADGAVDSQGKALDALRRGMAQAQAQMGQQQGMGPGGPNGPGRPGRAGRPQRRADQDTDPLGRPLRGRDYGDDSTVKVPGEIDAQRARRILEELRRRFGELARPQLELDYIERLLKDY
jgi:uncharacterized protein (TIGR02302 family)